MADNVTLDAGTGGAVIRTDEDSGTPGLHWQYVKLAYGADNTQTIVSTSNPIPVDIRTDNLAGNLDVNLAASGITLPISNTTLAVVGGGTEASALRVTLANDSTGVITVDGTVAVTNSTLAVVGGGTEAAAMRVTLANDSTGVLSVDDGGGSLTIDGTVAVSGTVPVSHSSLAVVGGGTEAAAMRVTLANDSTGVLSVDDGGGSITIDGTVAVSGTVPVSHSTLAVLGGGTEAAAMRVTLANDSTGVLSIDDNGGSLTVDGTVAVSTLPSVAGAAAHDAAISGNPVPVAARANANEPTAVANGDSTYLWADTLGRLVVVNGHPTPVTPVRLNATASGETTLIAAPGASQSIYVCKGSVHNSGVANIVVGLSEASGTNVWEATVAANGGGSLFDFGSTGWKLTSNTALAADLGAAGTVTFNVTEYYVAP